MWWLKSVKVCIKAARHRHDRDTSGVKMSAVVSQVPSWHNFTDINITHLHHHLLLSPGMHPLFKLCISSIFVPELWMLMPPSTIVELYTFRQNFCWFKSLFMNFGFVPSNLWFASIHFEKITKKLVDISSL